MVIQNMFVEDINRKINGVVKVDEDENKVLARALAARYQRSSHGRPALRLVTTDDGGDAA